MRSAPGGIHTTQSRIHASRWAGGVRGVGSFPPVSRLEPLLAALTCWTHARQHGACLGHMLACCPSSPLGDILISLRR